MCDEKMLSLSYPLREKKPFDLDPVVIVHLFRDPPRQKWSTWQERSVGEERKNICRVVVPVEYRLGAFVICQMCSEFKNLKEDLVARKVK
jgi:hypothetical protein